MADLHRLTGREGSRLFGAGAWLEWFERHGGGWIERDGEIVLMFPDRAGNRGAMDSIMHELETCDARGAVL